MSKKTINILLISFIVVLIMGTILFSFEKQNKLLKKFENEVEFYATIIEKQNPGYLVTAFTEDEVFSDEESLFVSLDEDLNVGDVVKIRASNSLLKTLPPRVNVISYILVSKKDNIINPVTPDIDKDASVINPDLVTPSSETIGTAATKSEANVMKIIDSYINQASSNTSSPSFNESIKNSFIILMDFIFYDSIIDGYKFVELTSEAKLKVIQSALYLDKIVDSKIPDYKNTLSSNYNTGKDKLVSFYLETTTSFCEGNDPVCATAKSDFLLLKKSLGLSWNFVATLAKNNAVKIKSWYEIFSGK